MTGSPELNAYVDEGIELARGVDYHPTVFIGMRQRYGTTEAISRLMISPDEQSGFGRMLAEGLRDHTLENTVLLFSQEFRRDVIDAAIWRLDQAGSAS